MKSEPFDIQNNLPPENEDVLVYDKSRFQFRVMQMKYDNKSDNTLGTWFDENGYYDDSDPIIEYWWKLPNKPK